MAVKLVTRAEYRSSEKLIEKLRAIIIEIEEGKLRGAVGMMMVVDVEAPNDKCFYSVRTSGMTNAQALWLLKHGERALLNDDDDNG